MEAAESSMNRLIIKPPPEFTLAMERTATSLYSQCRTPIDLEMYTEYMEMMRAAARRADISLLMNMPEPEEWTRQLKEKAVVQNNSPNKKQTEAAESSRNCPITYPPPEHILVTEMMRAAILAMVEWDRCPEYVEMMP